METDVTGEVPRLISKGVRELNGTFLLRRPEGVLGLDPVRRASERLRRLQSLVEADDLGGWPRLELVLDGTNLLPFHFLRTGDRVGRAVVKIQRDDGSTGTGFLVASDILLTNHHVLPDPEVAAGAVALANYEVSPPNDPTGRPAVSPLDPAALFITSADLDFTFCGVRGLDYLGVIPLDRERMHVATDETVTIIQHPRGRPKEISLRDNRVVQADGVVVQYSCDTEPGSSGSPVFNNQWKPVAIHHASVLTDSAEGRRVAGQARARYLNEGIRLSAIALWLETAEANAPEYRESVARLRTLFGGLNPRAGFFGALGRRSHGRPASEVVADGPRDRAEIVDVGLWDTRVLVGAPGGLSDRAAEVGRVMADMGLDLWCLTHTDPAGLDAVCEYLWAAHGLSYQRVPIARAGARPDRAAPGFLARPSRTIVAEPVDEGPDRLPPRVRLRATTRHGDEIEFLVVPAVRGELDAPGLNALARALRRGEVSGSDWLLLGDADLLGEAEAAGLLDGPDPAFVAGDPSDGAVVFLAGEGSTVVQAFASPNLRPSRDLAGHLAVVQDRNLPASLQGFPTPWPVALRLVIESGPAAPPPAGPLPSIPTPGLPRSTEALDALIERKLRDLLTPVVAGLLAEAKGAASPVGIELDPGNT